jgi:hypothetical protein
MRIAVIGSGYVGLVTGACLAELGHEAILVDNDPAKYAVLARGECPIYEEHLPELLARHRGKRLAFSDCLPSAVRASRAVFIAVGTPPTHNGEADLSYVESVARAIAGAVNDYKVIVGKSTVPVYTSDWVRRVMVLNRAPCDRFDVASNPEFLREGTAVIDFLYPDRIVIGANTPACSNILREIYQPRPCPLAAHLEGRRPVQPPIHSVDRQPSAAGLRRRNSPLADRTGPLQACEKFLGTTNTVLCYRQTFRGLFCCCKHCLVNMFVTEEAFLVFKYMNYAG